MVATKYVWWLCLSLRLAKHVIVPFSVAFLGGLDDKEHNKWFPHNRRQLRDHDPRAYEMLCRIWGVEDD